MLTEILNHLAAQVYAAGLHWGATMLDGSSEQKLVSFEPEDPNMGKLESLRMQIKWMYPHRVASQMPLLGSRITRVTNPLTGEVLVEKPAEYRTHMIQFHLYMKEKRVLQERTVFSIGTEFRDNQERLLGKLGMGATNYQIIVGGYARGFSTVYAPVNYPQSNTLDLHGIYQFQLTYPVLNSDPPEPAFIARKVTLIYGEPPEPPRDLTPLTATSTPIVLPPPAKIKRIGAP